MSESRPQKMKAEPEALFPDRNLLIIFGITLMAVMGVSSITPLFPTLVQKFNVSAHSIGLLITVFTFPGILLTPVLGVMADRYGRKKILVPSLLLFSIAGGSCGFAHTFNQLLILRFLQGVGASSLGSLNITLLGDLYSDTKRIAAMGYNASVLSIGTAAYPAIGGALALLAWNFPFFLPFLALPLGFAILFFLNNPEPRNDQHFLTYLRNAWQSVKNRQVFVLFAASVITFIILYGPFLTYFPLFLGRDFKASPLTIGLIMSSMSITTAITSSQLSRLSRIFQQKTLLQLAFGFYTLALIITPFMHGELFFIIPAIILGVAQGMNMPTIQNLLAGLSPLQYRAAFMSINGMVLRMGQTLGPLIIAPFFTMWGIQGAFTAGAGFSVLMLIFLRFF